MPTTRKRFHSSAKTEEEIRDVSMENNNSNHIAESSKQRKKNKLNDSALTTKPKVSALKKNKVKSNNKASFEEDGDKIEMEVKSHEIASDGKDGILNDESNRSASDSDEGEVTESEDETEHDHSLNVNDSTTAEENSQFETESETEEERLEHKKQEKKQRKQERK